MSLASAVGATFAQALGVVAVGLLALKYLYRVYQAVPSTARYLGAFIIDLTLVLHRLFLNTLPMEPPRHLSEELIDDAVKTYKDIESAAIHRRFRDINPVNFEQHIGDLIRESLRMD